MTSKKLKRKGIVKRKYLKTFHYYLKNNFPEVFKEFHYIVTDSFEKDFKSALKFFANRFKNTLDKKYIIHITKLYELNDIHKSFMYKTGMW